MRLIERTAIIGGATVVAIACGTGATAGAQTLRPAPSTVTPSRHLVAATAPSTDPFNAGYVGSTSSASSLSATVKVPALKCTPNVTEIDYLAVFLDGVDAGGTSTSSGGDIYLTCDGGDTLSLDNDGNSGSSTPVSAGDTIEVSVSAGVSGDTESYDDVTSGVTAAGSGTGFTPDLYQTTIQGGFGDGGVFPGFTTINFKSVLVSGAKLKASGPERYDEVDAKGRKEIKTSTIASNGSSFAETFVAG